MRVRSVSQITRHIKTLLDCDDELVDVWVEGEVSNFTRASSGHCYFTLKDSDCELRCVMWRSMANRLQWMPQQGDHLMAHGYISVYERGGAYQFYADTLEHDGLGMLWQEFLLLKDALESEGLFAPEHKRPLPPWPRRIGVVTSPTAAAFQDILNVLRARYPLVEVVLSPSLVQGAAAPAALVEAIERLGRRDDIDVVIVARGGGSIEDLWAFNSEQVARALAACSVPVVTGVGHETDFTIVDFVADVRAPTPSAAAAAVVPDMQELRAQLCAMADAVQKLTDDGLTRWRDAMMRHQRTLERCAPERVIAEYRQRLDDMRRGAATLINHRLSLCQAQLRGQSTRLRALSPTSVMARGYAIVQNQQTGIIVQRTRQVALGDAIRVYLADGHLGANVTDISNQAPDDGQEE
jgi:exodeoxyribonuclease VII large subunit